MPRISVIGICGNSIFMYADHFHQNGETLVADSVFEEIGGKGIRLREELRNQEHHARRGRILVQHFGSAYYGIRKRIAKI